MTFTWCRYKKDLWCQEPSGCENCLVFLKRASGTLEELEEQDGSE